MIAAQTRRERKPRSKQRNSILRKAWAWRCRFAPGVETERCLKGLARELDSGWSCNERLGSRENLLPDPSLRLDKEREGHWFAIFVRPKLITLTAKTVLAIKVDQGTMKDDDDPVACELLASDITDVGTAIGAVVMCCAVKLKSREAGNIATRLYLIPTQLRSLPLYMIDREVERAARDLLVRLYGMCAVGVI